MRRAVAVSLCLFPKFRRIQRFLTRILYIRVAVAAKLDVLLGDVPSPSLEVAEIWAEKLGAGMSAQDIVSYAQAKQAQAQGDAATAAVRHLARHSYLYSSLTPSAGRRSQWTPHPDELCAVHTSGS